MRYCTFLFPAVVFFFSLFFVGMDSFAASKAYLSLDEKIELTVSNASSKSEVEWVISQDGAIIDTKKGKTLQYSFPKIGEYLVRTSVTDRDGNTDVSVVEVVVSSELPNFAPLSAVIASVPASENKVITLSGETAEVTFSFRDSTGTIEKYEFEADVFSDSDGDGIIDNDIDNKNDPSYLSGTFYTHTYINTGIPAKAVLRVFDEDGSVEEESVTLVFDESGEDKTKKPLKAVLNTVPESDDSGNIPFSKSGGTLLVFAGESFGDISEYQIYKDGSEIPENKNSDSIKDGSVFPILIDAFSEEQEISLTVVSSGGQKNTITKTLVPSNAVQLSPSGKTYLRPLLFASRSKILEGQTVTFKVFNASDESRFSWDFNGDGIFEMENSEVSEVEYKYSDKGIYSARVEIVELGNSPIVQRRSVSVFDRNEGQIKTIPPEAKFLAQFDGNKVSFLSSDSKADPNLINTDLSFSWDFGDGYRTEGPNPVHVYQSAGEYTVVLSVEDSVGRTAIYSESLTISDLTHDFDGSQHGGISIVEETPEPSEAPVVATTLPQATDVPGEDSGSGTANTPTSSGEGFSFPWWILLILGIFLLPALFLIKKKIDEPDKSFSDIVQTLIYPPRKDGEVDVLNPVVSDVDLGAGGQSDSETDVVKNNDDTHDVDDDVPDWMRSYDDDELEGPDALDNPGSDTHVSDDDSVSDDGFISPLEEPLSLEEGTDVVSESADMEIDVESNLESNLESNIDGEGVLASDDTLGESIEAGVAPLAQSDGAIPDWMNPSIAVEDEGTVPLEHSNVEENQQQSSHEDAVLEEVSPFDADHPEWLEEIKSEDEGEGASPENESELPYSEEVSSGNEEGSVSIPDESFASPDSVEVSPVDFAPTEEVETVSENQSSDTFDTVPELQTDGLEDIQMNNEDIALEDLEYNEAAVPDLGNPDKNLESVRDNTDSLLPDTSPVAGVGSVVESGVENLGVVADEVENGENQDASLGEDTASSVSENIEIDAIDAQVDRSTDNSDVPEWLR